MLIGEVPTGVCHPVNGHLTSIVFPVETPVWLQGIVGRGCGGKEIELGVPECPPGNREETKGLIGEVVWSLVKPLCKWLPCGAHLLPNQIRRIVSGKATKYRYSGISSYLVVLQHRLICTWSYFVPTVIMTACNPLPVGKTGPALPSLFPRGMSCKSPGSVSPTPWHPQDCKRYLY